VNIITLKQVKSNLVDLNSLYTNKFNKQENTQSFEAFANNMVEETIKQDYVKYIDNLKNKVVVLRSKEDPSIGFLVRPFETSRYSPAGQRKLSKTIRKRFNGVDSGVFLTLTFDPRRVSLLSAWGNLSSLIKHAMNYLKIYAKREAKTKGLKLNVQYIWVIEVQKNGYPHVHVFYPSIKRLIDVNQIQQIWGVGYVFIKKLEGVRIGEYMSKYLAKGQGLEMALPFVWYYKIRLHGASNLVVLKEPRGASRYEYVGSCYLDEAGTNTSDLIGFMRTNKINIVKEIGSEAILLSLT